MKRKILYFTLLILSFFVIINSFNSIISTEELTEETEEEISLSSSSDTGDNIYLNIDTNLPFSVDYSNSELLQYVKKGDILYDSIGKSILWKKSGHCGIVEGIFYSYKYKQYYIRTIEANPDIGVTRCIVTPDRFNSNMYILRVDGVTSNDIDNAVDFCISQLGASYDLHNSINYSKNRDYGWYCSELVGAAYKNTCEKDLDTDDTIFPTPYDKIIAPKNIYLSSYTHTILKSAETTKLNKYSSSHEITCDNQTYSENHKNNFCKTCDYNNTTNIKYYAGTPFYESKIQIMNEIIYKLDVFDGGLYIIETLGNTSIYIWNYMILMVI